MEFARQEPASGATAPEGAADGGEGCAADGGAAPGGPPALRLDRRREAKLAEPALALLRDGYLRPGETAQDLFARVVTAYADDQAHAQRLYDALSKLWFLPSPQILLSAGAGEGAILPVSGYVNSVPDSLTGVLATSAENAWMAANGGSIGTCWGDVSAAGRPGGLISFLGVADSLAATVAPPAPYHADSTCYLDISHPDIEAFLALCRAPAAPGRAAPGLRHGVLISDSFMEAVRDGSSFSLLSPDSGACCGEVDARALFQTLVETRLATGEPYLLFIDKVNAAMPAYQRELGLRVRAAGPSAALLLPAGKDHLGRERAAACCQSSLNLEAFDEWQGEPRFIEDVMRFLDNALSDFLARAPEELARARHGAERERPIGLGVTGFHSFLHAHDLAFESAEAKEWNNRMFRHIRGKADEASMLLAAERGACPDARDRGVMERFSCKMALAPTAFPAVLCGGASSSIEPLSAYASADTDASGQFILRNRHLQELLIRKAKNSDAVWDSILQHGGSVQHLDILDAREKAVFRTAFEIDQRWLLELAADRAPFIDQAQSLALFLATDVEKWDLMLLHYRAWELGIKSLYELHARPMAPAGYSGAGKPEHQSPERQPKE